MKKIAYLHPVYRLSIAICLAVIFFLISLDYPVLQLIRIMISWEFFALIYLALAWITFYSADITGIRKVAQSQDGSHFLIFVILLSSTLFSLLVILLVLKSEMEWKMDKKIVVSIYFLGIFFSWMLLHTIYSFRYAHLYYGKDKEIKDGGKGIIFPGEKDPDYIDFAYFSFVIGMTFQVSDTSITSRQIRHIVLIHSLISFGFNVVIIALCVNAVVSV